MTGLLLGKRNPSEIKNLFQTKNHLEKTSERATHRNAMASLRHPEVHLKKKRLKKDCSEKQLTRNLALVDLIQIKNLLAIENLWAKKNHSVTENRVTENQAREKQVIESRPVKVNPLQELLLKNHQRLEHLDRLIQNQKHQNVKHAFKKITDFA